jgi:hypothetical protein
VKVQHAHEDNNLANVLEQTHYGVVCEVSYFCCYKNSLQHLADQDQDEYPK